MLPAKISKLSEEARLSKLLFSQTNDILEPTDKITGYDSHDDIDEDKITKRKKVNHAAAWHDEDDDNILIGSALDAQGRKLPSGGINNRSNKYKDYLNHKYESLVGNPEWANLDKSIDNDSDEEILQSIGHIGKSTKTALRKGILEFKRLKYLNTSTGKEGPIIKVIEFHPKSSVALVAGLSGIVSLLTVDGKKNEKLHSVSFKKFPVQCGHFTPDGCEAFIGSTYPYYYVYDLMNAKALRIPLPNGITKMNKFVISHCGKYLAIAGRFGEIHLLCTKSKELIQTLKQGGDVTSLTFSPDSTKLFAHGSDGNVTVWNVSSRRVLHKWIDNGCISGSSLAISSSGEYFATGSDQGVVNIYETKDTLALKDPLPKKILLNLTTKISGLKFNPSSEMLAFYSSSLPNAFRLVHLPSFEVYSNFPGPVTNLAHCSAIDFSPNGGYLSFGNNKKLAYLYRLKHYKNY